MGTLWTALENMPDHRTVKGRHYSLTSIISLSLAAILLGANDLRASYRWGTTKADGTANVGHRARSGTLPRNILFCVPFDFSA